MEIVQAVGKARFVSKRTAMAKYCVNDADGHYAQPASVRL